MKVNNIEVSFHIPLNIKQKHNRNLLQIINILIRSTLLITNTAYSAISNQMLRINDVFGTIFVILMYDFL
jgi:hypothetical protein